MSSSNTTEAKSDGKVHVTYTDEKRHPSSIHDADSHSLNTMSTPSHTIQNNKSGPPLCNSAAPSVITNSSGGANSSTPMPSNNRFVEIIKI